MQSSVAISAEPGRWFLINASPDVTTQIERYLREEMGAGMRSSPISEIFITNADIDHSLGLLLLREGEKLRVTVPEGARQALVSGLHLDAVLDSFCGIEWLFAPVEWTDLPKTGLQVRVVPLAESTPPRYASDVVGDHAVGYLFRDARTHRQVGIFPDVPALNSDLLAVLAECDALFFDGTFWSNDELGRLGISSRTAQDMGHVPISGNDGSLSALSSLQLPMCAYLHLNNTNPVLDPHSPERREIESAGLRIAEDGLTIEL